MTSQDVRPLLNRKSPPNSTLAPGPAPTRLRFRLSVKFMLVAAALLLPLGVAIYSIAGYSDDDIAFGRTEQTGVAYVAPLSALLQELAKSPASKAQREFDELLKEPESRAEQFGRAAKFALDYGLPVVGAAGLLP